MYCRWILVAMIAVVVVPRDALSQPVIAPKDGKLIIPATVSRESTAVPALKYLLLPELRHQLPGNRVQAFYKCSMEQHAFYHDKSEIAKREAWSTAPLAELAGEKALIGYGGSGLRQADFAARLESADWGILDQFKAEGINLLLPDVQQMRQVAGALRVRLRGEIARKDYDAAVRTLQTMFALATTFNQHPTLIGQLVGLAIANITLGVLEELQQQPGAPNLFWALASLPTPLIDLRKGMEGERLWLPKDYELLRKAEPIPEAVLNRRVRELTEWISSGEGGKKREPASEYYSKRTGNAEMLAAMKRDLIKLGHKDADLDKLSPLQIVMMEDFSRYERYRDDLMKWANQPFWTIPPEAIIMTQPEGVLPELAPAAMKVIQARTRLQQYFGLLQTIEGLRAFAAEHQGKLPGSLSEIKLPVPVDPVTGKPFLYEVKDGTATLRGAAPENRKDDPYFNRVYQVTIRK